MSLHGVDQTNENDSGLFSRDISTTGESASKFLVSSGAGIVPISFAAATFVFPAMFDVFLAGSAFVYYLYKKKPYTLPFRLPSFFKGKDFNDLAPGSKKPKKAGGISFYGNVIKGNNQVWFNNDDLRRHAIIFGTTGSGKSEALISICFNSLIQGSGFVYCDGKGDNGVFWSIYSMIRRVGREDDLLVINYMTSDTAAGSKKKLLSNMMNPFFSGSASSITELIASLMGSSGGSDDMWQNRALTFVASLIKMLCYLRDQGEIVLSIAVIRSYMTLDNIHELYKRYDEFPKDYIEGLAHFIRTIPGMDKRQLQSGRFSETVLDQFGYISMQLTHSMNMLSDEYAHIFNVDLGDVDFYDVVINRRILIVLLPALSKSPASLANLGKVIVASLKQMMAYCLGSELEGDRETIIDSKPTTAPSPYIIILDEYGYYAVEGAAVMPAQARSLGFGMIFAGQDYQAFRKGDEEGAASIVANCAIKICMKLEDPNDTYDIFFKRAGEAEVTVSQSFNRTNTGLANRYLDTGNVGVERRGRVNVRDLVSQTEGEAHLIFGDSVCRMSMFYAAPKKVFNSRLNEFIRIHPPSSAEIESISESFSNLYKSFIDRIDNPKEKPFNVTDIPEIAIAVNTMNQASQANFGHMESSIAAFIQIEKESEKAGNDFFDSVGEYEEVTNTPATEEEYIDPFTDSEKAKDDGFSQLDDILNEMDGGMPPPPQPVDIPIPSDQDISPEGDLFNRAGDAAGDAAGILDSLLSYTASPDVAPSEMINQKKAEASKKAKEQISKVQDNANYPKKPKPKRRDVKDILSLFDEIKKESASEEG